MVTKPELPTWVLWFAIVTLNAWWWSSGQIRKIPALPIRIACQFITGFLMRIVLGYMIFRDHNIQFALFLALTLGVANLSFQIRQEGRLQIRREIQENEALDRSQPMRFQL